MAKKAKSKFAVGGNVTFKGYKDDVPENERLLTEGETYPVVDVNEDEESLGVEIENPDFNSKKKENAETNPKTLVVDVFFDEVDVAEDADDADEDVEEAAPAPKAKAAAKAAPKVKAKAKVEEEADDADEDEPEEEAPAPKAKAKAKAAAPAAKGKAKGKTAAKGKAEKKAKPPVEEVDEAEALPALAEEDADIVELIEDADLLELANEFVSDAEALNYKLGGVLYHLRLGKSYQEVDKKYAVKGGWQLFIEEQIPGLGYRKAMNLIEIYYAVNLYGIDPAKVQEVGWTKFSKIAPVMDADNAEDLVALAEEKSVKDLSATITESYKEVGGTKGDKRKKIAFKFRLWEDQANGVLKVLTAVQEAMGFKDESDAFEHIVMEWAVEHPIEPKAKAPAKATAKAAAPAAKASAPAKATARR